MKERIDIIIKDYMNRAPMPERESILPAKKALADNPEVQFFTRKRFQLSLAIVTTAAVFLFVTIYFGLLPAKTTYAENLGLITYAESSFPSEIYYSVTECYDIKKGDSAVGAMINMFTSHDSEGISDDLHIIIEYSRKYTLADSRFTNLPLYAETENGISINALGSLDNDDFLILAAFCYSDVRICVEIRSTERLVSTYRDIFEVYMSVFTKWTLLLIND